MALYYVLESFGFQTAHTAKLSYKNYFLLLHSILSGPSTTLLILPNLKWQFEKRMRKRITTFWSNFLSFSREILSSLLLPKNQITRESVNGSKLSIQHVNCEGCLEEQNYSINTKCLCELNKTDQEVKIIMGKENSRGGNCSFAHSVINMVGMLIGKHFILPN